MTVPTDPEHPRSAKHPRSRANTALIRLVLLAAAPALAAVLAALWPPLHRPFQVDRAAHFVLYSAPALLALALAALALRRRPSALALGVAALVAIAAPVLPGRPWAIGPADGSTTRDALRVLTFNARSATSIRDRAFVDWALDQDADLVAIVDAPTGLLHLFPELAARYPHRVLPERGRQWPIILLSTRPLRTVQLHPRSRETRSSYVANSTAKVSLDDGRTILFTAMHPFSPRTHTSWRRSIEIVRRDGQILRDAHERYGEPVIVAGDFNSTPVGRTFREFARASAFHTAAWPLPATWPAKAPRFVGVAIDHVWVSPGVDLAARRVGPSFNSDHRPVVVDLLLPSAAPAR